MGRLRTIACRSGQEVCVEIGEEMSVRELRQQVLATLGLVEASCKEPMAGVQHCLASNQLVADLLGLKGDVLALSHGLGSAKLLQPWSFDTEAVHLGTCASSSQAGTEVVEVVPGLGPAWHWAVEAISFVETELGQGYILFGKD
mmetsp:Transcript_60337/g.132149  ORF Transcript_60337/g.132149 Transcript_60337/m.132149 type:complete len:144 (+) Transcript_60337:30-461(+)